MRFVVLESRSDDKNADRRVEFYRRLGGKMLAGVDYKVEAADGTGSIPYSIIIFDRREPEASGMSNSALTAIEALHRRTSADWSESDKQRFHSQLRNATLH